MMNDLGIVWLRQDLRAYDHEPLYEATKKHRYVIACYWFRTDGSALRKRFLEESLDELRDALFAFKIPLLIIRTESLAEFVSAMQSLPAKHLYFHQFPDPLAMQDERELMKSLPEWEKHRFFSHTLYHPDDHLYLLDKLPRVFTEFRRIIEKRGTIRQQVSPPLMREWPPWIFAEQTPDLTSPSVTDEHPNWRGGSAAAHARIRHYFKETDGLRTYKETRNGMLRFDDSGKISPWLADGSLSPRYVYEQIRHSEQSRGANESTYWFYFELLWRDYFQFVMLTDQHGQSTSASTPPPLDETERVAFQTWCNGTTGFPLVDAAMRELSATGYTSNRARQNVASFLCHYLKLDWRHGAAWFKTHLLDYDAASNDGNWRYLAGKGNDPRSHRVFNVIKQAEQYDPQGEYLRHWLPERFD